MQIFLPQTKSEKDGLGAHPLHNSLPKTNIINRTLIHAQKQNGYN